jgi:F-type H+-transporting ATPase subunit b
MNLNLTLIGQTVAFLFVVLFTMKYIWPALIAIMKERQETIAEGLRASEEADQKLALASSSADAELVKAKSDAAKILDQARDRANQMINEAKIGAREEADRILESAQAEILQESNKAKEALRSQVSSLVIRGAEQVLGNNVDASKHDEMLNKLASEL